MKIQLTKNVGDTKMEFVVDEQKDIDALSSAGFIASIPTKCTECGSEDVSLESNKKDGYTFVKVACHKCTAKSNLGTYKDGGHFWKKFEKYAPIGGSTTNAEITNDVSTDDLNQIFGE